MPEPGQPAVFQDAARRLMSRCDELGQITDDPGKVTRTYLSPATGQAHTQLAAWMRDAGLSVRVDPIGNVIGRLAAPDLFAPVLLIGSHIDTVPNAGRYDGILGVLAALEIAQALRHKGDALPFHLDVIAFSEEEGVRFNAPFIGSLGAVGQLTPDMFDLADRQGRTLRTAIQSYGLDPEAIEAEAYPPGKIAAYLEIHIEQGPALEMANLPLGVVTAISGQTRLQCRITGETRHAGTTPMVARRDALSAAAAMVLATEQLAVREDGLVATVGSISVEPNATNCIAGSATFSLDLRHEHDMVRGRALAEWKAQANTIAEARRVRFEVLSQRDQDAIPCDARLTLELAQCVAAATGSTAPHLPSGAGHDAMILARVAPMAMLFVRCAGGISHHPDEAVAEEDVELALQTGTRFVQRLSLNLPLYLGNAAQTCSLDEVKA